MLNQEREWRQIIEQGYADVICDACGVDFRIEPDCDMPCPCGEGRLVSPLVDAGLI